MKWGTLPWDFIRAAMEKMKVIYEQNPSLGDAQQVAQRLEENHAKIEEINAEIEEFRVRDSRCV